MFHRRHDPACEITAVDEAAFLFTRPEHVQWIVASEDLVYEVWNDVTQTPRARGRRTAVFDRERCRRLADTHAVERPHDRVRKAVLVARCPCEVLDRELAESVRGPWRRHFQLLSFHGR